MRRFRIFLEAVPLSTYLQSFCQDFFGYTYIIKNLCGFGKCASDFSIQYSSFLGTVVFFIIFFHSLPSFSIKLVDDAQIYCVIKKLQYFVRNDLPTAFCPVTLLSDTEKLFFLLLIVKICAKEILSQYMFVYIQTCIVDLVSGHRPFYVINKTERVSLYACACFFITKKIFFLFSKSFIFKQTNRKKSFTISFLQFQYYFSHL